MEGPRSAKPDELDSVISLINNVFRVDCNFDATMQKEFPILLCNDNIDNIRIIKDGEKPIAAGAYYKNRIFIQSCYINAGSIGSVCTDPRYRGKALASGIIDDIEEKMKSEGIDVELISGRINLYLRRGCSIVGNFGKVVLNAADDLPDSNDEIIEYSEAYLDDMIRYYNMEPVRYYRTRYEYENFFKGATFDCCIFNYRTYLFKKCNDIAGYAVIRIISSEGWAEIVELAGNREVIYKNLRKIALKCGVNEFKFNLPGYDPIFLYAKADGADIVPDFQYGTVKILNFEGLINKLRPYFAQYIDTNTLNKLYACQKDGKYQLGLGDELLETSDINMLNQMVFGCSDMKIENSLTENLNGKKALREFIRRVFPVPMPSTYNMNYI